MEELNQASDTFNWRNPFVLMRTYSEGRVTSTVQSKGRTMGRPRAELIAEGNHWKALHNRLRDNLRAAKLSRQRGKKHGKRDRSEYTKLKIKFRPQGFFFCPYL